AAGQRLRLLLEAVLPTARAAVESARRSYQVGKTEFLTLLAVQDADYRAQLEGAGVAAEYLSHVAMLLALTAEEP
ncbi:MAG: hypothetical protein ACREMR_01215, partial [Gemmatimonadales bacterium]